MRIYRHQFKYALRSTKRAEETERDDALAADLSKKNCDEFWRSVNKLIQSNYVHATTIDNTTGDKYISMYWKEHFHKILNSNIVDENLKLSIVSTLYYIQYSKDVTVSWKDVSFLTSQLECGNAAGPDGVCAETIKFAHDRIAISCNDRNNYCAYC